MGLTAMCESRFTPRRTAACVMKSTENARRDDLIGGRRPARPRDRGVAIEVHVRPGGVVVLLDVLADHALQMPGVERDDVVGAVAPYRRDHALDEAIHPGRAVCRAEFLHGDRLHDTAELLAAAPPEQMSAQKVLAGQVTSLEPLGLHVIAHDAYGGEPPLERHQCAAWHGNGELRAGDERECRRQRVLHGIGRSR